MEGALDLELALVVGQAGDRRREPGRWRNVAVQIVDRLDADLRQHLAAVGVGEGEIAHGTFLYDRLFTNASYAFSSIRPSSSALSASLTLKNQPLPIGSALTSPGESASAPLPSITSPVTGE